MENTPEYERMSIGEIERVLETDVVHGISREQAIARLSAEGENAFRAQRRRGPIVRITDELRSPLSFTLLVAGILSTVFGEYVDSTIIFCALALNIAIDLYQEGRASRAFAQLSAAAERSCVVVRDGEPRQIFEREVVRGDLLLVSAGAHVPADARIVEAEGAQANESVLTGEWEPVEKVAGGGTILDGRLLAPNMLFAGTLVASGVLRAVVTATGEHTAFGKVAAELRSVKRPTTPMEAVVAKVSRILSYVILGVLVVLFGLGLYRGVPLSQTMLIAVAVAVAAIPEGLPASVSVMLAMGMRRIMARGGLVRSPLAAEALGAATVIVTDKTGTLTEGNMAVERVVTHHGLVHGGGRFREHRLHEGHGDERDALSFAALACNVVVEHENDKFQRPEFHGRPAEVAIARAALISGVDAMELHRDYPRIDAIPFLSGLRLSAALCEVRGMKRGRIFVLGAAEEFLDRAAAYYAEGRAHAMQHEIRAQFAKVLAEETVSGARVLAVGYVDTSRERLPEHAHEFVDTLYGEGTFVFCGVFVLSDPLRTDVPHAIAVARTAGIRVVMATGDNPETARAVAIRAGIARDAQPKVMTGAELDALDDGAYVEAIKNVGVFARMLPAHKLRLARVLVDAGEVVAMTGDGVNDAPALRASTIGVALGGGTDVAKESSGLVLANDSFSTIVAAIEEGRRIGDNVRKVIAYLLSMTFPETVLIATGFLFGWTLPLLPAQIIWSNMLTEGFMSFAFAFEPAESHIMLRVPDSQRPEELLSRRFIGFIVAVAAATSGVLLWLYIAALRGGATEVELRTVLFAALTLLAVCMSFSLKDLHAPIWKTRPWSNLYLLGSFGFALVGLGCALFVPWLASLLVLEPHALALFGVHIAVALVLMFFAVEGAKYLILGKNR